MFKTALSKINKRWKQAKCPTMEEQVSKLWCIHTIFLSYKKEYSTEICYNMEEPENTVLSKRNQTRKVTYCMIPFKMKYQEWVNLYREYRRCLQGWWVWGNGGATI